MQVVQVKCAMVADGICRTIAGSLAGLCRVLGLPWAAVAFLHASTGATLRTQYAAVVQSRIHGLQRRCSSATGGPAPCLHAYLAGYEANDTLHQDPCLSWRPLTLNVHMWFTGIAAEDTALLEALHGTQALLQQSIAPQDAFCNNGEVDLQMLEVNNPTIVVLHYKLLYTLCHASLRACCLPICSMYGWYEACQLTAQGKARASMEAHFAALPAGLPVCSISMAPGQPDTWLLTRCTSGRTPVVMELRHSQLETPDSQVRALIELTHSASCFLRWIGTRSLTAVCGGQMSWCR